MEMEILDILSVINGQFLVHPSCSIRIRYNITSSDYDIWNIDYDAMETNNRL